MYNRLDMPRNIHILSRFLQYLPQKQIEYDSNEKLAHQFTYTKNCYLSLHTLNLNIQAIRSSIYISGRTSTFLLRFIVRKCHICISKINMCKKIGETNGSLFVAFFPGKYVSGESIDFKTECTAGWYDGYFSAFVVQFIK